MKRLLIWSPLLILLLATTITYADIPGWDYYVDSEGNIQVLTPENKVITYEYIGEQIDSDFINEKINVYSSSYEKGYFLGDGTPLNKNLTQCGGCEPSEILGNKIDSWLLLQGEHYGGIIKQGILDIKEKDPYNTYKSDIIKTHICNPRPELCTEGKISQYIPSEALESLKEITDPSKAREIKVIKELIRIYNRHIRLKDLKNLIKRLTDPQRDSQVKEDIRVEYDFPKDSVINPKYQKRQFTDEVQIDYWWLDEINWGFRDQSVIKRLYFEFDIPLSNKEKPLVDPLLESFKKIGDLTSNKFFRGGEIIISGKINLHKKYDKRYDDYITKLSFIDEGSSIELKAYQSKSVLLNKIYPESKDRNAYIKLVPAEQSGSSIIEADFTAKENFVYNLDFLKKRDKEETNSNKEEINNLIYLPKDTRFLFKDFKLSLELPATLTQREIVSLLNNIRKNSNNQDIRIKGNDLKLPNGAILEEGYLTYNGKDFFIAKGDSATINGIKIYDSNVDSGADAFNIKQILRGVNENVFVYFDSPKKELRESYIAFDISNKKLSMQSKENSRLKLIFTKNNPFIKVETEDSVRIDLLKDVFISLKNRDEERLYPEIIIKKKSQRYSDCKIKSGEAIVSFYGGTDLGQDKISISNKDLLKTGKNLKSSPLILIPKEHPQKIKIIISDSNQLEIISLETEEKGFRFLQREEILTIHSEPYKPVEETNIIFMPRIKNRETIMERGIMHQELIVAGDLTPTIKQSIMQTITGMPQKLKQSVEGIIVYSEEEWKKERFAHAEAWAYSGRILAIRERAVESSVIYHEIAHLLTYQLLKENDFMDPKGIWGGQKKYEEIKKLREEKETKGNFGTEWAAIENLYGEDRRNYFANQGKKVAEIYSTPPFNSNNPMYGFTRSYGATSVYEDVATFVEEINKNPELFRHIINPKSDYYIIDQPLNEFFGGVIGKLIEGGRKEKMTQKIAQEWANKYRKKLDLLYKYGFITTEVYKTITR